MRWLLLLTGVLIALPAWWLRDRPDLNAKTYRYTGPYTLVKTYPNGKHLISIGTQLLVVTSEKPPLTKTGTITNDGFETHLRVN
jgi:hypothetical protein